MIEDYASSRSSTPIGGDEGGVAASATTMTVPQQLELIMLEATRRVLLPQSKPSTIMPAMKLSKTGGEKNQHTHRMFRQLNNSKIFCPKSAPKRWIVSGFPSTENHLEWLLSDSGPGLDKLVVLGPWKHTESTVNSQGRPPASKTAHMNISQVRAFARLIPTLSSMAEVTTTHALDDENENGRELFEFVLTFVREAIAKTKEAIEKKRRARLRAAGGLKSRFVHAAALLLDDRAAAPLGMDIGAIEVRRYHYGCRYLIDVVIGGAQESEKRS